MLLRSVLVVLTIVGLAACQNSTDDLEVRVTLLEDDVADLQDELEEVETANTLQDQRFDNVEDDVSGNADDIDGLTASVDELQITSLQLVERMEEVETLAALLQQAVSSLVGSVSDLEIADVITDERVSALEASGNETNARVTNLETELFHVETSLNSTIDSLNVVDSRVTLVEGDVADLETVDVEFEDRIDDLEEIIEAPWEACTSSPCENGGTCIDVNVDTFVCECRDGFFGTTCGASYSSTTFVATFEGPGSNPGAPVVFDLAVINAGGNYNTATGIYTVPVAGTYEFYVHFWAVSNDYGSALIVVDNVPMSYTFDTDYDLESPDVQENIVLSLTEGQQVWVELGPGVDYVFGSYTDTGMLSWFSGHLLSPA